MLRPKRLIHTLALAFAALSDAAGLAPDRLVRRDHARGCWWGIFPKAKSIWNHPGSQGGGFNRKVLISLAFHVGWLSVENSTKVLFYGISFGMCKQGNPGATSEHGAISRLRHSPGRHYLAGEKRWLVCVSVCVSCVRTSLSPSSSSFNTKVTRKNNILKALHSLDSVCKMPCFSRGQFKVSLRFKVIVC